jgi:hypothetical protein
LTVFGINNKRLASNVYLLNYFPAEAFKRSAIERFFHAAIAQAEGENAEGHRA